jgi:hypothetical protein
VDVGDFAHPRTSPSRIPTKIQPSVPPPHAHTNAR